MNGIYASLLAQMVAQAMMAVAVAVVVPLSLSIMLQPGISLFGSQSIILIGAHSLQPGLSLFFSCLLYTSPSPRDATLSRMPSSA